MTEEENVQTTEEEKPATGPTLNPIDKDIDLLPGYEVKKLKPSAIDFLEQQVSVDEAFSSNTGLLGATETRQDASSLQARWSKFKNFCLTSFQTNASDFAHTNVPILFSKQVRDHLAELAVTSDEAQMITLMQQNEEKLRVEIKKQAVELEKLHKQSMHWEMIELISKACQLLINTKSPQFYPAQFMMVLDLVECFGKIVYERIASHPSNKNFLTAREGTRELLALNWSMILCRTSKLLPRLLLQTAFLRCIKFHPFKTIKMAIDQIISAIPGLGTASSGIYVRSYLVYTIFTFFPETSSDVILPLFTSYTRSLIHIKEKSFAKQFKIIDYTFPKYIETHRPALCFVLSVMVSAGDTGYLKTALDEFNEIGKPSSFILSCLLEELPPKFVSKIYPVLLILIDKCDSVIPQPKLIHALLTSLSQASLADGIMDLMNDIWERMRTFKNVEDFVFVAVPMTKFISLFCPPYYLNLFLSNVVQLLHDNFAGRSNNNNNNKKGAKTNAKTASRGTKELSKKLADCVSECITITVNAGVNFAEVLQHVGSIVDLMDFLNENSLVHISRFILNDIMVKPFELNDPLCIRILLELSQTLYQSLNVLTAVDVVEKTNAVIENFLYRVDFGNNVDAHLNFLISARQNFPTSPQLLSSISRIALRLATHVAATKPPQYNVTLRSLFSFVFVTVPSITDLQERATLQVLCAQTSLVCGVICFAHSYFDEFVDTVKLLPLNRNTYDLIIRALNLLLLMPTKPDVSDPYQQIREFIISSVRKAWPDDESVKLALESLILMPHTLRSQYQNRIPGVYSNDTLFAGNDDFRSKGIQFMTKMLPRFTSALAKFSQKGVMASKTKVPTIALRAMSILPDLYAFNDVLLAKMKELANFSVQGDSKQIIDLRKATVHHLTHVLANDEKAMKFVRVLSKADEE